MMGMWVLAEPPPIPEALVAGLVMQTPTGVVQGREAVEVEAARTEMPVNWMMVRAAVEVAATAVEAEVEVLGQIAITEITLVEQGVLRV